MKSRKPVVEMMDPMVGEIMKKTHPYEEQYPRILY